MDGILIKCGNSVIQMKATEQCVTTEVHFIMIYL